MKKIFSFLVLISVLRNELFAQEIDSTAIKEPWEFNADLAAYFMTDDFFLVPVVSTNHGHLHLEARYNYEDFQTGSVFGGYNFSVGNKLTLDATPLIGVSFGNTNAIIPGAEFEITCWNFGLYAETEYVFDLQTGSDSYFNYWGELYYAPADWIWFGITTQKIRVQETPLDLQRGIMLALQKKWITITGYYFNPFSEDDFWILNLGASF